MCLLNLSLGLGLGHWSFNGVIAFNKVHVLSILNSKLSPNAHHQNSSHLNYHYTKTWLRLMNYTNLAEN